MSGRDALPVGVVGARSAPDVSLVVGRALGTVVVTVDGTLNLEGSQVLARLLSDLIEGQGNLVVAVDLGKAIVEPEALTALVETAQRARDQSTKFILDKPPTDTRKALQAEGFAHLVEVPPQAASARWTLPPGSAYAGRSPRTRGSRPPLH